MEMEHMADRSLSQAPSVRYSIFGDLTGGAVSGEGTAMPGWLRPIIGVVAGLGIIVGTAAVGKRRGGKPVAG